MATILDLSDNAEAIGQPRTVWRDELLPATFAGQPFFCEANSREGGQRIVTHEFPKRDLPYSETMGRRAMEFTVRGYCIVFPFDTGDQLYQRDYRTPRNLLINALDSGEPGLLQLPTQAPMWVCCTRYRMAEEERFGGYCTFDMTFVEYGKTENPAPDVTAELLSAAGSMIDRVKHILSTDPNAPPESNVNAPATSTGS